MNTLYLECNSGISGDMLVAALLDLGADEAVLREALDSVPAKGFTYEISRVKKAGVDCCDFAVNLDADHENHDHDMGFLHGAEYHHHHEHLHGAEHHHHEHRGLKEVIEIISGTKMTENARMIALKIFDIIAAAEAKAHAVPKEAVHFHEVGAVDSIVDITAIAVCADNLQLGEVIIPKLCEGNGTVRCQHGVLPVPVPAVANIVQAYGFNLELMPVAGEFVTPTGAAAAAALCTGMELPGQFKIKAVGMGAGKRQYERPSILRAMLIEPAQKKTSETGSAAKDVICQLECNVDDCGGEVLGYVLDRLLEAGALDVQLLPCYMKKNRPAYQLQVLCPGERREVLEQIIFAETTTIGIRCSMKERSVLPRRPDVVETEYGSVQVKRCQLGEGQERVYPEYASCAELAKKQGVPLAQIYKAIR